MIKLGPKFIILFSCLFIGPILVFFSNLHFPIIISPIVFPQTHFSEFQNNVQHMMLFTIMLIAPSYMNRVQNLVPIFYYQKCGKLTTEYDQIHLFLGKDPLFMMFNSEPCIVHVLSISYITLQCTGLLLMLAIIHSQKKVLRGFFICPHLS